MMMGVSELPGMRVLRCVDRTGEAKTGSRSAGAIIQSSCSGICRIFSRRPGGCRPGVRTRGADPVAVQQVTVIIAGTES